MRVYAGCGPTEQVGPGLQNMLLNRITADGQDHEDEPSAYAVLGDRHLGTAIARGLRADGHTVRLVDESVAQSDRLERQGGLTDPEVLQEAGIGKASTVVVATRSDSRNLLVAQLARAHFDISRVVVLANDPDRFDPIAAAGHDPVCATSALSDAIVDGI